MSLRCFLIISPSLITVIVHSSAPGMYSDHHHISSFIVPSLFPDQHRVSYQRYPPFICTWYVFYASAHQPLHVPPSIPDHNPVTIIIHASSSPSILQIICMWGHIASA
jgi:hypothetical protein